MKNNRCYFFQVTDEAEEEDVAAAAVAGPSIQWCEGDTLESAASVVVATIEPEAVQLEVESPRSRGRRLRRLRYKRQVEAAGKTYKPVTAAKESLSRPYELPNLSRDQGRSYAPEAIKSRLRYNRRVARELRAKGDVKRAQHHEGLVAADLAARERLLRADKPEAPLEPSPSSRVSVEGTGSSSSEGSEERRLERMTRAGEVVL